MIQVMWVSRMDVDKVWAGVEPLIDAAIKRWLPLMDTDDVLKSLHKDIMQLWIAYDDEKKKLYGAVVTEILPYPKAKMCNVFLLGGNDIRLWKDEMGAAIEDFAKKENCAFLQAMGREGWHKLFPDMFESATIINKILVY